MSSNPMDMIRVIVSRITALFRHGTLDEELDEELRAHIDLAIEENVKRGMSPDDARTAALRAFGAAVCPAISS